MPGFAFLMLFIVKDSFIVCLTECSPVLSIEMVEGVNRHMVLSFSLCMGEDFYELHLP